MVFDSNVHKHTHNTYAMGEEPFHLHGMSPLPRNEQKETMSIWAPRNLTSGGVTPNIECLSHATSGPWGIILEKYKR